MLLVLDRSLFRLSTSLTVFLTSDVSKFQNSCERKNLTLFQSSLSLDIFAVEITNIQAGVSDVGMAIGVGHKSGGL